MFRFTMFGIRNMVNNSSHVRVSPHCGICTDAIFVREEVIALLGIDNVFTGHTVSRSLPNIEAYGYGNFCRSMDCACERPEEVITVHAECFEIFVRFCELKGIPKEPALQKLWIFAAWRLPWRHALPMDASYVPADSQSLQIAGQLVGLPFIHKLPTELLLAIWKASRHSLFWKCVSVTRLVTQVEIAQVETNSELQVVRLDKVLSWQRDEKLECAPVCSMYPITRLTIDQEGIKKVERLCYTPEYTGECHTNFNYIVQSGSSLRGVEAHLQDGRLRLRFTPSPRNRPYIWNTPAPPDSSQYGSLAYDAPDTLRRRIEDIQNIQGITFFFLDGHLLNVYYHHSDKSCASYMYEQFAYPLCDHIAWVYLPTPKADKLVVLAARSVSHGVNQFLFRMEKAGDITIGRTGYLKGYEASIGGPAAGQKPSSEYRDRCLVANSPTAFVSEEPKDGCVVPTFGAYRKKFSDSRPSPGPPPLPSRFFLEKPNFTNVRYENGYYSRAPLGQIMTSTVFYNPRTGNCKGILLQYENGGSRALGQCRINKDPSETVTQPTQICLRDENRVHNVRGFTVRYSYIKVAFIHDFQQDEHDKGWKRHSLEGFIEFWFRGTDDMVIHVTDQFNNDIERDMHW